MTAALNKRLGFVGGGVMAEAILARLLASSTSSPEQVFVREISVERSRYLQSEYHVIPCDSYQELVKSVEILILAVKPQVFSKDKQAFSLDSSAQVETVFSIMAGTSVSALESVFSCPVVRVMPNTPATVGAGMSAIALGHSASSVEQSIAQQIFEAVGQVVTVPESSMDAVTALSGSGPAYIAIAIEALADAGVSVGLPRQVAAQLALQTVLGSAELLHLSQLHPAVMKDKVASPGGTTIAGITALEKAGFRNALIEAVQAAYSRSKALAQLSES